MIIREDFELFGEVINEDIIKYTPKNVYKHFINKKVRKAAFESYLKLKESLKRKIINLNYNDFEMQPYLNSNKFSTSTFNDKY